MTTISIEDKELFSWLNDQDVLLPLSAGINSMAVLCWLIESGIKPKRLHIVYAHFSEHSPDSFQFVADGIRYARKHFDNVLVKITSNHVLRYFKKEKMIPHPMVGNCSKALKILMINEYAFNNNLKIDLVGYVKHELKKRSEKQQKKIVNDLFSLKKYYPIGDRSDEWCFEIVLKHIGWYPKIYDILNEVGKRIFKHNNCLPCKNMYPKDILYVKKYYPEYYNKAMKLSDDLKLYWGRDEAEFYTTFGRDLGQDVTCNSCKW